MFTGKNRKTGVDSLLVYPRLFHTHPHSRGNKKNLSNVPTLHSHYFTHHPQIIVDKYLKEKRDQASTDPF